MQLDAYLARIGYAGALRPDLATLCALHRAHLLAIPYESLDMHLGRRLTLDLAQIFAKLVDARRGGWCCGSSLPWICLRSPRSGRTSGVGTWRGQVAEKSPLRTTLVSSGLTRMGGSGVALTRGSACRRGRTRRSARHRAGWRPR
jgi:hypothetical protein